MVRHAKKKNIGKQLLKAIDEKGIKVVDLAKAIGVSQSMIYKYTNDIKDPSDETLEKISDFFDLPIEYFTEEPYSYAGQSLIDFAKEALTDMIDNQQLIKFKNSGIKHFNYTFEDVPNDVKREMVLDLFDVSDKAENGQRQKDLKDDPKALAKMNSILSSSRISISNDKLIERLSATSGKGIVYFGEYHSFIDGYEAGVKSTLNDSTFYRNERISELISQYQNTKTKVSYDYDSLIYFEELLDCLNNDRYYLAIKKIDLIIKFIERDTDKAVFDLQRLLYIPEIYELNREYFDLIVECTNHLISNRIDGVKNVMTQLRKVVKDKECNNFSQFYQQYFSEISLDMRDEKLGNELEQFAKHFLNYLEKRDDE